MGDVFGVGTLSLCWHGLPALQGRGVVTKAQATETFERMAAAVDGQNTGDLVSKGLAQPSGYTELLLHAWRLNVKAGMA